MLLLFTLQLPVMYIIPHGSMPSVLLLYLVHSWNLQGDESLLRCCQHLLATLHQSSHHVPHIYCATHSMQLPTQPHHSHWHPAASVSIAIDFFFPVREPFCPERGICKHSCVMYSTRPANIDVSEVFQMINYTLHNHGVPPFPVVIVCRAVLGRHYWYVCAVHSTNTLEIPTCVRILVQCLSALHL